MSAPTDASVYNKDRPFPAKLTENRLLTKTGSGKETRHFVVDIAGSGLTYKVGDSLGVYPTNRESEVKELLGLLGVSGHEMVTLPRVAQPTTLRDALSTKVALAGPTSRFLHALAAKVSSAAEKDRLTAMLDPAKKEQTEAYLEQREFADLLAEYPDAKFTPQEFVEQLRRLQPRLYSIASSPKVFPHEVHLTVATVRYETNNRQRVGVCSTFLADRIPLRASAVPVFVSHSHFGVPEDASRDIIMVGPGTGVAPFRAFLQERVATNAPGRNWLFFGEQRRASDFLYEEEWNDYVAKGHLARLSLAWSRDQAAKDYVQNHMMAHAADLWAWLKNGAAFYVCGDAKRMAKDVDRALHQIIEQQGGMDAAAAIDYVKLMKKERRYQRDVY